MMRRIIEREVAERCGPSVTRDAGIVAVHWSLVRCSQPHPQQQQQQQQQP